MAADWCFWSRGRCRLWLFQCVYTVQPDARGVVSRFGVPAKDVAMPGLHFHFWPFERVEMVKVTEQQAISARSPAPTAMRV